MGTDNCTPEEIALSEDFNNSVKCAVFYRNLDRDVGDEPLIVKQENGRFLVHEDSGLFGKFGEDGESRLAWYADKEQLEARHGNVEDIRTYDQYKTDSEVLTATPGLGRNLSENSEIMKFRIKELNDDMQKAGESFELKGPEDGAAPGGM